VNSLSQIADIIEETLIENQGGYDPRAIAEECARNLITASLQQLASTLGTDLDSDMIEQVQNWNKEG